MSANDEIQPRAVPDRKSDELAEAHEEILRLRDLLIGKDAELGRVKGQVAELEERLGRYTWLADKLRVRRIVSAIGRRINKLRRRG